MLKLNTKFDADSLLYGSVILNVMATHYTHAHSMASTAPTDYYSEVVIGDDGGEIGVNEVHLPSAPVKCLAYPRNRANSQWYSRIYEDQRPHSVEDIERSDGKKSA